MKKFLTAGLVFFVLTIIQMATPKLASASCSILGECMYCSNDSDAGGGCIATTYQTICISGRFDTWVEYQCTPQEEDY